MREPSIAPSRRTMMTVIPVAINNSTNVKARSRGIGRVKPNFLFGRIIIGLVFGNEPHVIALSLICRRRVRWDSDAYGDFVCVCRRGRGTRGRRVVREDIDRVGGYGRDLTCGWNKVAMVVGV